MVSFWGKFRDFYMRVSFPGNVLQRITAINQPAQAVTRSCSAPVRFGSLEKDQFEKVAGDQSLENNPEGENGRLSEVIKLEKLIGDCVREERFRDAKRLRSVQLSTQQKLLDTSDQDEKINILITLGNACLDLRHDAKALEHYANVLKIVRQYPGPETNSLTIAIMETMGEIFRAQGDYASAEAEFAGALQMALDDTVEKLYEPSVSTITPNLMSILHVDAENPREQEADMLNEDPQTWLHSRVSPSTVH
jgi:tetratricopeptide (TPR) repeat protein